MPALATVPTLDRPALLHARTVTKGALAAVTPDGVDPLRRAELSARVDVIEALLGMRDLHTVIAEYRPEYRPDPLLEHDSLYNRRAAASYGALDEYMRWVEQLDDYRRCAYTGCAGPLLLGVDDTTPGDYEDVFCADSRDCLAEAKLQRAMGYAWTGR